MSKRRDAVIKAVRALEPNLGAMLEDAGIPGCTARVVFEDGDGMSLAMGQKSRGRADSPDGGTVFMIGSCSKAFTALTASALAYRGTVDLDAPISSHVPVRFEGAGGEVTLRHLLTNTSGIPNLGMSELVTGRHLYGRLPNGYAGTYPFGTSESAVIFANGAELASRPGDLYIYSNEGFSLAAEVLAAAAGRPFPDLVEETVLGPIGMSSSGYREADLPPRTEWADGHAAGREPAPPYFEPAIAGAGGLLSTADDMGRFVQALLTEGLPDGPGSRNRVIPLGVVREIEIGRVAHRTAESLVGPGFGPELYGMGLMIYPDFLGTRVVTHGGSTGHFSSSIFIDRELGFGMASLCNGGTGEGILALFAFMVAAAVLGRDPASVFPGLALERRRREREGDYACRGDAVSARISYGQGRLWWEATDGNGNSPEGPRPIETRTGPAGPTFWYLNGPGAESEVFFFVGTDGLTRVRKDRNVLTRREPAR